jgi:hypothetical protein
MMHTQASMTTDAELEDCQMMRDVSSGTDLVNIPVSATWIVSWVGRIFKNHRSTNLWSTE